MKLLRLGAVLMFATATTFACSDDDAPTGPVAGSAGEGGESSKGGSAGGPASGGGGEGGESSKGGSAGGPASGGEPSEGGSGGAAYGGASQGGEPGEGGDASTAGAGGAHEGGATAGGAGGAGPHACENEFDSSHGGDGAGGAGGAAQLEIVGEYVDNFGFEVDISDRLWNDSGIIEYDNEANVVYTQYPCDDPYNPNKFAKIVYTEPASGAFYFCMIEYNAESLAAAKASTKVADSSTPDTSGCGAFSWSKALPE